VKLQFLAYGAPDCPLVRLFAFDTTEAKQLKQIFDSLASGSRDSISLEQPLIHSVDGSQLTLRIGTQDAGVLQRTRSDFECLLTDEGWANVAFLAEPFCRSAEPNRYQWLNEDSEISLLLSPDGGW
jgi:hypothetical protein